MPLSPITRTLCVVLFILCYSPNWASDSTDEDDDIRTFLSRARRPVVYETWAKLSGTVKHKAHGERTRKLPIELRAHVNSEQVFAQVIFNSSERFLIRQNFVDGNSQTIRQDPLNGSVQDGDPIRMAEIGLRPDDLTLSFLYWDFDKELESEKIRGQHCRVVKLRDGDENFVHVWISRKYYFPLKIEWRDNAGSESVRSLEFTGFKKVKEMWVIKELKNRTTTSKTIVEFENYEVDLVTPDAPLPVDLFIGVSK